MNPDYLVVLTTFSKPETGERIVNKLLGEKLAACVQSLQINSAYTWKGTINHDAETLLLIKTKAEHYAEVEKAILSVHDYETPEIIATPVLFGSIGYLKWVDEVTK